MCLRDDFGSVAIWNEDDKHVHYTERVLDFSICDLKESETGYIQFHYYNCITGASVKPLVCTKQCHTSVDKVAKTVTVTTTGKNYIVTNLNNFVSKGWFQNKKVIYLSEPKNKLHITCGDKSEEFVINAKWHEECYNHLGDYVPRAFLRPICNNASMIISLAFIVLCLCLLWFLMKIYHIRALFGTVLYYPVKYWEKMKLQLLGRCKNCGCVGHPYSPCPTQCTCGYPAKHPDLLMDHKKKHNCDDSSLLLATEYAGARLTKFLLAVTITFLLLSFVAPISGQQSVEKSRILCSVYNVCNTTIKDSANTKQQPSIWNHILERVSMNKFLSTIFVICCSILYMVNINRSITKCLLSMSLNATEFQGQSNSKRSMVYRATCLPNKESRTACKRILSSMTVGVCTDCGLAHVNKTNCYKKCDCGFRSTDNNSYDLDFHEISSHCFSKFIEVRRSANFRIFTSSMKRKSVLLVMLCLVAVASSCDMDLVRSMKSADNHYISCVQKDQPTEIHNCLNKIPMPKRYRDGSCDEDLVSTERHLCTLSRTHVIEFLITAMQSQIEDNNARDKAKSIDIYDMTMNIYRRIIGIKGIEHELERIASAIQMLQDTSSSRGLKLGKRIPNDLIKKVWDCPSSLAEASLIVLNTINMIYSTSFPEQPVESLTDSNGNNVKYEIGEESVKLKLPQVEENPQANPRTLSDATKPTLHKETKVHSSTIQTPTRKFWIGEDTKQPEVVGEATPTPVIPSVKPTIPSKPTKRIIPNPHDLVWSNCSTDIYMKSNDLSNGYRKVTSYRAKNAIAFIFREDDKSKYWYISSNYSLRDANSESVGNPCKTIDRISLTQSAYSYNDCLHVLKSTARFNDKTGYQFTVKSISNVKYNVCLYSKEQVTNYRVMECALYAELVNSGLTKVDTECGPCTDCYPVEVHQRAGITIKNVRDYEQHWAEYVDKYLSHIETDVHLGKGKEVAAIKNAYKAEKAITATGVTTNEGVEEAIAILDLNLDQYQSTKFKISDKTGRHLFDVSVSIESARVESDYVLEYLAPLSIGIDSTSASNCTGDCGYHKPRYNSVPFEFPKSSAWGCQEFRCWAFGTGCTWGDCKNIEDYQNGYKVYSKASITDIKHAKVCVYLSRRGFCSDLIKDKNIELGDFTFEPFMPDVNIMPKMITSDSYQAIRIGQINERGSYSFECGSYQVVNGTVYGEQDADAHVECHGIAPKSVSVKKCWKNENAICKNHEVLDTHYYHTIHKTHDILNIAREGTNIGTLKISFNIGSLKFYTESDSTSIQLNGGNCKGCYGCNLGVVCDLNVMSSSKFRCDANCTCPLTHDGFYADPDISLMHVHMKCSDKVPSISCTICNKTVTFHTSITADKNTLSIETPHDRSEIESFDKKYSTWGSEVLREIGVFFTDFGTYFTGTWGFVKAISFLFIIVLFCCVAWIVLIPLVLRAARSIRKSYIENIKKMRTSDTMKERIERELRQEFGAKGRAKPVKPGWVD